MRFHTVYWPAFLMSAGIALPKRVFGHGFLINRGEKMSKSVGNVVDPFTITAHYGVDQVRYFFMREVSFGQDGVYSHEAIVNRINADLANDLGNLAQRSLSMIGRYADGVVPRAGRVFAPRTDAACRGRCASRPLPHGDGPAGDPPGADGDLAGGGGRQPLFRERRSPGRFARAIRSGWRPCSTSPRKSCVRSRSWCSRSCRRRRRGCSTSSPSPADARSFASLGAAGRLAPGTTLPPAEPIFPRYVEKDGSGRSEGRA